MSCRGSRVTTTLYEDVNPLIWFLGQVEKYCRSTRVFIVLTARREGKYKNTAGATVRQPRLKTKMPPSFEINRTYFMNTVCMPLFRAWWSPFVGNCFRAKWCEDFRTDMRTIQPLKKKSNTETRNGVQLRRSRYAISPDSCLCPHTPLWNVSYNNDA